MKNRIYFIGLNVLTIIGLFLALPLFSLRGRHPIIFLTLIPYGFLSLIVIRRVSAKYQNIVHLAVGIILLAIILVFKYHFIGHIW